MKKYLFLLLAICAVAFCGCSKDDDGGVDGTLMIDGVNIVGIWADTDKYYHIEDGLVDVIVVITETTFGQYRISSKKYEEWRNAGIPSEKRGFEFKDGYLYGCSMKDFEVDYEAQLSVKNGKLYIGGFQVISEWKFTKDAIIDIEDPKDQFVQYNRVKGFK